MIIFNERKRLLQWTPLNGITLGQTIINPFNRMIPITEHMSYNRMLLRGMRDLINQSHFDPIIRMIPLTVIPLSGAHCTTLSFDKQICFKIDYFRMPHFAAFILFLT
jgi:hypothetical protein